MYQELVIVSMIKLKTILLSNASKYIHIAIVVSLFLYAYRYPLLFICVIFYLFYLFKHKKSLISIIILFLFVIAVRMVQVNSRVVEEFPMSAKVVEIKDEAIVVKNRYKYILYVDNPQNYHPGMILYIDGLYIDIDQRYIKHQMDYEAYLTSQNIMGMISPNYIQVVDEKPTLYYFQYHVEKYIDKTFSESVVSYINLFVLGDKALLNPTIYNNAKNIGISHLFAVSGMHIGIIIAFMNYFLSMFYMQRKTRVLLLMALLFLYNTLTGFSISIVRASLLFLIVFVFKGKKYHLSKTDVITMIFLGFIIYQPYLIYTIGFQLSFLISTMIVLTKNNQIHSSFKQMWYVSFIAVVFSLPILLSINYSLGLINIIIGPIFIIFVGYILLPGAFILMVFPLISSIYMQLIRVFEMMIVFADEINFQLIFSFNYWPYVIIYWMLLLLTFVSSKILLKKIIVLWMIFALFLFINPTSNLTKVIVFDVNQGDAIYVQSKSCRMLIDTGVSDDYDALINYFYGENIHHLDALIITHSHSDHLGEANDLLSDIRIEHLYVSHHTDKIMNHHQEILSKNDVLKCGDFYMEVISAYRGDSNDNNNSLVIFMSGRGESWLLTGDIEKEVEEEIISSLPSHIDHLKVAHHGSNTSTSEIFLEYLNIDHAYISYGKNSYGIPSFEVIQRLSHKIPTVFSTYEHGSIEVIYLFNYRMTYLYKTHQRFIVKT